MCENNGKKGSRTLFHVALVSSIKSTAQWVLASLSTNSQSETDKIQGNFVGDAQQPVRLVSSDQGKRKSPATEYDLKKTEIQGFEEFEPKESTSLSRLHDVLQAQRNDTVLKPFDTCKAPAQPFSQEIENMLTAGHLPHPEEFPRDHSGKRLPISILKNKKKYCRIL